MAGAGTPGDINITPGVNGGGSAGGNTHVAGIRTVAGITATAINVVAQVIILINVYDINRWFVGFGVGLLIMSMAIYIERSRERLRERARELSDTLERWE